MHQRIQQTVLIALGLVAGAVLTVLAHRPLIRALAIDHTYGMPTRNAFEQRMRRLRGSYDVVLLDIDQMKQLNTDLGYAEVNRLIRAAFQLRDADIVYLWRHFSGDEIGIVVKCGQGAGLQQRLADRLASFGLSAQIAVVTMRTLPDAIAEAEQRVLALKAQRPIAAHPVAQLTAVASAAA